MTKPNDTAHGQFHGLTKREYFAAMALQGILANEAMSYIISKDYKQNIDYIGPIKDAIDYADTLIVQLNKTANDQPD